MVAVPQRPRRRLAAGRPRRPGPRDRGPDQHARSVAARPAAPRAAAGRLHQQRLPGLGLSIGAVGAGLLVQFVPSPTDWAFGVLTAVFLLAAAGTYLLPESSPRLPGAVASPAPRCTCRPRTAWPSSSPCRSWSPAGRWAGSTPPRPVAGRRRVRHRQPPGRRAADPRAQRHRHRRLARPAHLAPERALLVGALVFTVGVAGTLAALVRHRRRDCCSSRRWSPGSASGRLPRAVATITHGVAGATGRTAGQRSSSSATWRSASRDRRGDRRRRVRSDPDDGGLRRVVVVLLALLAVGRPAARAAGSASRGGRPPSGPPSPRCWRPDAVSSTGRGAP